MPHHDDLTPEDWNALVEKNTGPCVSIFLSTERITQDTDRNRIQLKNMRGEAYDKLTREQKLRRPDAESLLEPVDEVLEDDSFWPYLSDGLAIFLAQDQNLIFRLAHPFTARVVTGSRFIVKPLIPLLTVNGIYYIISISRNSVRLFEGTRHGVTEIKVDEMPTNMARALTLRGREGERAPHRQWHGDEGQKTLYRKFFRQIDRALRPYYGDRDEPVVVAGVDYLLHIFHNATSYRGLLREGIPGNPEELSEEVLHARAWPLVEPVLDSPRRQALEQWAALRGTDRVTEDVSTILGAARDGRIQTLFVNLESNLYGTFDPDTRSTVFQGAEGQDVDLGGLAARSVFRTGGQVYACTESERPSSQPLRAIMRY